MKVLDTAELHAARQTPNHVDWRCHCSSSAGENTGQYGSGDIATRHDCHRLAGIGDTACKDCRNPYSTGTLRNDTPLEGQIANCAGDLVFRDCDKIMDIPTDQIDGDRSRLNEVFSARLNPA